MRDHLVLVAWRSVSGSSKDCGEWEGVCVSQELQRTAKENRDEVENPNLGHEVQNEEQAQRTETANRMGASNLVPKVQETPP